MPHIYATYYLAIIKRRRHLTLRIHMPHFPIRQKWTKEGLQVLLLHLRLIKLFDKNTLTSLGLLFGLSVTKNRNTLKIPFVISRKLEPLVHRI